MKISVVTVAWNAASTIGDTLESVAAQVGVDCEHVIIDGGSTDATLDIVRSYARPNLNLISETDEGIYDAMSKGMKAATGDLVGFLNSDDYFCRSDALALLAQAAEASPQKDAVAGAVAIVDPAAPLKVIRSYGSIGHQRWMMRCGHMMPHPAFYVRRSAIEAVGVFDPSFKVGGDFDWMVRFLFTQNLKARTIGQTLVAMRAGGVSTQGISSMRVVNREISQSLRTHGVTSFTPLVWGKYVLKSLQMLKAPSDYPAPSAVRWPPVNP